MKFKSTVVLRIQPEMAVALPKIDAAYEEAVGPVSPGDECVITSANDATHGKNSLHPKGLAVDVRIRDPGGAWKLTHVQIDMLVMLLRTYLNGAPGADRPYNVVVENDHIHIEHDPK